MDQLDVKKRVLEELLEHLDMLQGEDLKGSLAERRGVKPEDGGEEMGKISAMKIEAEPMGEEKPDMGDEKSDELVSKAKGMEDGEEMSEDELEELLKGLS